MKLQLIFTEGIVVTLHTRIILWHCTGYLYTIRYIYIWEQVTINLKYDCTFDLLCYIFRFRTTEPGKKNISLELIDSHSSDLLLLISGFHCNIGSLNVVMVWWEGWIRIYISLYISYWLYNNTYVFTKDEYVLFIYKYLSIHSTIFYI